MTTCDILVTIGARPKRCLRIYGLGLKYSVDCLPSCISSPKVSGFRRRDDQLNHCIMIEKLKSVSRFWERYPVEICGAFFSFRTVQLRLRTVHRLVPAPKFTKLARVHARRIPPHAHRHTTRTGDARATRRRKHAISSQISLRWMQRLQIWTPQTICLSRKLQESTESADLH